MLTAPVLRTTTHLRGNLRCCGYPTVGFGREMLVEPLDSRSRDISASSNPAFEYIVTAHPSDSKLGHSELCDLRFLHLQLVGMWHVGAIPPNAHRG